MLIQEPGDFKRVDVFSALQETASKCGYRVRVRLDQVCEDRCESYLVFQGGYGLCIVGKESRQGM